MVGDVDGNLGMGGLYQIPGDDFEPACPKVMSPCPDGYLYRFQPFEDPKQRLKVGLDNSGL